MFSTFIQNGAILAILLLIAYAIFPYIIFLGLFFAAVFGIAARMLK
jgi:hypothetical protein